MKQRRLRIRLRTPAQAALQQIERSAPGEVAFLVESNLTDARELGGEPPIVRNDLWRAGVTEFVPRPVAKVTGVPGNVDNGGSSVVRATTLWEVATFWAVTGGLHDPISRDSGVCVHDDPYNPGTMVITFMTEFDLTPYGNGVVWPVPLSEYGFRPVASVPWVVETDRTIQRANYFSFDVSDEDLLVRPLIARADPELKRQGFESRDDASVPYRGVHEPFDDRYACGATGGQIYRTPSRLYAPLKPPERELLPLLRLQQRGP